MLDDYIDLVMEALKDCTDKQAACFMETRGILPDGTLTDPVSIHSTSKRDGVAESVKRIHLAYAEAKVYRHICLHLIKREQSRQRVDRIFPGTSTNADIAARYSLPSEDAVRLGPGTQAFTSATKSSTGTSTVDVHRRYSKPTTPHTGPELLRSIWGKP